MVRLVLEIAAELELDRLVHSLGGKGGTPFAGGDGGPKAGEGGQQLGNRGPLAHARVVPALHVPDLVAHHAGELIDAPGCEDRSAVQIDVAARDGEGVQRWVLHHAKPVEERLLGDPAQDRDPEIVDEGQDDRVVDQCEVLRYLQVELHAEVALAVLAHLGHLPDRVPAGAATLAVGGAGREQRGDRHRRG